MMRACNRRAFLKRSVMLTAGVPALGQLFTCSLMTGTQEKQGTGNSEMTNRRGSDHPFFKAGAKRPEVIAHRGGMGQWPGETLYAFEQATKAGADVLEMDIHAARDGELVLMHNDTIDETTNGTGSVRNFSLAELKRLDAGYRWTQDAGKTYPFRGQGVTVAALKEVFEKFPQMRMNIEIKQSQPSLIPAFCKMIRDYRMAEKVLVASFSDSVIREFRRQCPEVATSAAASEVSDFISKDGASAGGSGKPEPDALQVPYRVITKKFLDRAHQFNLQVHAWTVNDAGEMKRMIDLGVDGIITDFPGPLLTLLGRTRPA